MNKKMYVVPAIKAQAIESDTLLAASGGVNTVTGSRPSGETDDGSHESENQFSKENSFSSVWEEE